MELSLVPVALFPVIASVTAAMIAASIAFLGTVLSKEQKTSEFRQAWIDAIRSDISEFVGFVEIFSAFVSVKYDEEGAEGAIRHITAAQEEFSKAAVIYHRIRLRLNPKEHKDLLNTLRETYMLFSGKGEILNSDYVDARVEEIVKLSHTMLKSEWRRVKHGESTFFYTKYISLALVLVTLVAVFVYVIAYR